MKMNLETYSQKRNFNSTTEPKDMAIESNGELIFVVQKHAASHLHYDFRLECDDVLKSWAVPKGPSMNPDDKRLAIMVEDHPYSYKDFEGNIPDGNYGAGNVIVWDNGTYQITESATKDEAQIKFKKSIQKGHINFILRGKKLKGEFSLVKLKDTQKNEWLLIKKKDINATAVDILNMNKSVISSKTLENLAAKTTKDKTSGEKNNKIKEEHVNGAVPAEFMEPMLANSAGKPFDDKNWIFEIKYDGYRIIAVINAEQVNLFSRNHHSYNIQFKFISDELKKLGHIAVLDGEVVIEDDAGRSDFQLLQNYQKTGIGILKYYVFDILNLNGNDTRNLSLVERKELVKLLINNQLSNVFYAEHITENGKSFFELAIKNNLEGIMAKVSGSPYRSGKRTSEWLKIKVNNEEEAFIVGITEPKGARNYFGAILMGQYQETILKYIGKCGTGFNEENLKELYSKFKSLFTNVSPLKEKIKLKGKVQWLEPKMMARIKFSERTNEGHLRHPVYQGLSEDKNADNVTIDNNIDFKIGKINLRLTNQNKIYFPDDEITKGDVINYYKEVGEFMLPYIYNRPQSMNRFPNGIKGKSFYHKDVDKEKIPTWLKTEKIYSESGKDDIDYLLCNDVATLLYMVNLGCIEINPWNSTCANLEKPDWMVIDLDPENIDFKEVVNSALVVKKVMDELEADCYCKTSGATGLHIYVPLAARYEYDTVKIFAELIAQTVNMRLPDTTSILRSVQKRQHKVYIDFLQNRHGQTIAAPYSLRPIKGASVSAPLEWKEVNKKLLPSHFTIRNIVKRIEQKGDLWKPVLGKGADLDKIINNISTQKQMDS